MAYNVSNTCGANLQNAFSLTALKSLNCVANNGTTTTNAMDPNFRVGYTQNWQLALQTNLKWNTVATVTYIASKGTGLPSTFYPNSWAAGTTVQTSLLQPGGVPPNCLVTNYCPDQFSYQGSNGNSTDEAVQFQLQRRLRSGLGGSVSYALNKAIDDTGTAQNWLNQAAERARSAGLANQSANFSLQYSTGVGARGGALVNGWKGVLFKDWTVMPSVRCPAARPSPSLPNGVILGGAASASERASYIGGPVFINGSPQRSRFRLAHSRPVWQSRPRYV